jgi:uncharacterized protein YacL
MKCTKCGAELVGQRLVCRSCREFNVWRWPLLGSFILSVLLAGIIIPLFLSFERRSPARILVIVIFVFGLIYFWYLGIDLFFFNREADEIMKMIEKDRKEKNNSETENKP